MNSHSNSYSNSHLKYVKTMNSHSSIFNIQDTIALASKMQGDATMEEMEEDHQHDPTVRLDLSQCKIKRRKKNRDDLHCCVKDLANKENNKNKKKCVSS